MNGAGSIADGFLTFATCSRSGGYFRYSGLFNTANGRKFRLDVSLPPFIQRDHNLSRNSTTKIFMSVFSNVSSGYSGSAYCADVMLSNTAKSKDVYWGNFRGRESMEDTISVYMPQGLSRVSGIPMTELSLLIEINPRMEADGSNGATAIEGGDRSCSNGINAVSDAGSLGRGRFSLIATASGLGSDRYLGELFSSSGHTYPMDVYLPQIFSRIGPRPQQEVAITFREHADTVPNEAVLLHIKRAAKASGGDRFHGTFRGRDVTIYLPQGITRENGAVCLKSVLMEVENVAKKRKLGPSADPTACPAEACREVRPTRTVRAKVQPAEVRRSPSEDSDSDYHDDEKGGVSSSTALSDSDEYKSSELSESSFNSDESVSCDAVSTPAKPHKRAAKTAVARASVRNIRKKRATDALSDNDDELFETVSNVKAALTPTGNASANAVLPPDSQASVPLKSPKRRRPKIIDSDEQHSVSYSESSISSIPSKPKRLSVASSIGMKRKKTTTATTSTARNFQINRVFDPVSESGNEIFQSSSSASANFMCSTSALVCVPLQSPLRRRQRVVDTEDEFETVLSSSHSSVVVASSAGQPIIENNDTNALLYLIL